jgi:predicted secreted protein
MIIYIFKRVSFIGLLIITIACNVNSGHANNQKLSRNDTLVIVGCQEKIRIELGSILEIKLEANSGTGYQWLLKDSSVMLKNLGGDILIFTTPDLDQDNPEQPGFQVLHFKAIKEGEENIQLEFRRTFEKGILKSCKIKIEVL